MGMKKQSLFKVSIYPYVFFPNIFIWSLFSQKGGNIDFKESNTEAMWKWKSTANVKTFIISTFSCLLNGSLLAGFQTR